jgi:hypothetical protein
MESNRLEAFSDGVLAIIVTIMVLELKGPRGVDLNSAAGIGTTRRSKGPESGAAWGWFPSRCTTSSDRS